MEPRGTVDGFWVMVLSLIRALSGRLPPPTSQRAGRAHSPASVLRDVAHERAGGRAGRVVPSRRSDGRSRPGDGCARPVERPGPLERGWYLSMIAAPRGNDQLGGLGALVRR